MNDIFVSWAAPDKPVVDRIISRLEDAGLPINEYSRKMQAGADIRQWINQSIASAKVVLALVSAESLETHRDWINYEFTLAVARLDQQHNKLGSFMLVRLGTLPDGPLPGQLQPDRVKFLDFDPRQEEQLIKRLTEDLRAALGGQAPFVIPTAQYAMTSEEFAQLHGRADGQHEMATLAALCQRVGMPPQPELWEELSTRYGQTQEDFAPYGDGRRLIDVAQHVLHGVNEQRLEQFTGRPLYLRWYSRDELAQPAARARWAKGHSLLVVDAVSALHAEIAQALQNLPASRDLRKRAVVCVPPYTRHTGALEHLIEESLQTHYSLSDAFRDWQHSELPSLAFDIPTETSLRQWLGQLLFTVDTGRQPLRHNVYAMAQGNAEDAPRIPGHARGSHPVIVTFYSYKGGVGRSMALVNVGEMLADVGYDVIVCDFDLEAPGLERYVTDDIGASVKLQANRGVIDLLEEYKDTLSDPSEPAQKARKLPVHDGFANVNGLSLRRPSSCAITIASPNTERLGRLRLLGAGRRDGQHAATYSEWVQHFNWSDFYKRWAGAAYIDFFRRDLTQDGTVVLIDSRTGVTEHGGICTYHLADLVVLLTAPNDINIEGTRWMTTVLSGTDVSTLRKDRPLQVMPVAARVEIASQAEELAAFRERFEAEFASAVPPAAGDARAFIQDAEIPYIPYFAFSEKVVARQTGSPHRELYRAYQTLAQAIVGIGLSRELLPVPRRKGWLDVSKLGRAEPTVANTLRQHKVWLESGHTAGSRAELRGYDLSQQSLAGSDLREANLTEVNLEQSDLREANLSGAELTDAILRGARLQDARLIGTNLGGSELTQAVLTGAVLDNARLEGANLEGANLEGAKLRFASLRRARLIRANLASCDLRDCDLEDATLLGADIRSADLTGATGVDGAGLKQAIVDDSTRLDQAQASALSRASAGRTATQRAAHQPEILPKQGQREFPGFAEDFRFLEQQAQPYFQDLSKTGKRLADRYRIKQLGMIALFAATLLYSLFAVVVLLSAAKPTMLEEIELPLGMAALGGLLVTGLLRWRDRSKSYRQRAERIRREYFIFLGRVGEYADLEKRYDRFKHNVQGIVSEAGSDG